MATNIGPTIDDLRRYSDEHGHLGLTSSAAPDASAPTMASLLRAMPGDDVLPPVEIDRLPRSMGVRQWYRVEFQGNIGQCGGESRAACCEMAHYRETGEIIQLNRHFAYVTAQKIDGIRGDNGSSIRANVLASRDVGNCLESTWDHGGKYNSNPPRAAYEDAAKRKTRDGYRMRSYDDVIKWLVHGLGGVQIGIAWNRDCTGPGATIEEYDVGSPGNLGGHAVALLDWDTAFTDSEGRAYIDLYNSHGKRYGDNGKKLVHPSVVDLWCRQQWVVAYTDMDGSAIRPRPLQWA